MKRVKIFLLFIPFVLLFLLTSCKEKVNLVNGTYYLYENETLNKSNYIIIESSNKWKDDDGVSGKCKIDGNSIVFYTVIFGSEEEVFSGTIGNGKIEYQLLNKKYVYYKEGSEPSKNNNTGNNPSGHTHTYPNEWKKDNTNHWKECSCGEKTQQSAHTYGEWQVVTPATTTTKGSKKKVCSVCSYEITEVIPKLEESHTHSYSNEWKKDNTNHWKECSCGDEKDKSSHTFGEWEVVTKATTTIEGLKKKVCSVCSYEITEVIPMLDDDQIYSEGLEYELNSTKTGYIVKNIGTLSFNNLTLYVSSSQLNDILI